MNREDYNFDPMTGEKIIKDDYNFDPMTGEKIVKTNEQSQQFNYCYCGCNGYIFGGCVRLCGILFGKRTQSRTKTCQSDFDVGGDKVVGGKAE